MKRKTLHTWLSCVALLLACLMVLTVLAGCKNPSENPTGTGTGKRYIDRSSRNDHR